MPEATVVGDDAIAAALDGVDDDPDAYDVFRVATTPGEMRKIGGFFDQSQYRAGRNGLRIDDRDIDAYCDMSGDQQWLHASPTTTYRDGEVPDTDFLYWASRQDSIPFDTAVEQADGTVETRKLVPGDMLSGILQRNAAVSGDHVLLDCLEPVYSGDTVEFAAVDAGDLEGTRLAGEVPRTGGTLVGVRRLPSSIDPDGETYWAAVAEIDGERDVDMAEMAGAHARRMALADRSDPDAIAGRKRSLDIYGGSDVTYRAGGLDDVQALATLRREQPLDNGWVASENLMVDQDGQVLLEEDARHLPLDVEIPDRVSPPADRYEDASVPPLFAPLALHINALDRGMEELRERPWDPSAPFVGYATAILEP
ncbi:MAG: hypothetical protein SVW77_02175 [Candidatus Nanohaloarchaea archaeon]|nr:hypothetical protein [Candidatus Nanohaloarchaea archaeon]